MKRILLAALLIAIAAVAFAPGAAALDYGDEHADLEIEQPPWIDDDVDSDRSANRTLYEVRGDRYEIELQGVDESEVTNYGVASGDADIQQHADQWVVEPGGEGTIALYWDVAETVEDGNSTTTTETRYTASLAASDLEWSHLSEDELEDLENDADNWSAVESEASSIDPERSTDEVLSVAFTAAEFFISPFQSVTEGIQATLMIMTLEPGGMMVLALFLGLLGITAALGFRWRNRYQKQLGDLDRVQTEMDEMWLNKVKRILQQYEWSDILPDHLAQTMHDMWGPNVWVGFKNYQLMRSPAHTKGLWLQMMHQIGYRGLITRNLEGEIVGARALQQDEIEDELRGDVTVDSEIDIFRGDESPMSDGGTEQLERFSFETLRFDNPEHRKIIDAIPASDLDQRVFLESVEIDAAALSLPITNHNVQDAELVRLMNPDIPGDFESYEQMATAHGKLLETVVNHPYYSDDTGEVDREMDLLCFMSELDSVLADKAEFAPADIQRKVLFWVAENMDDEAKLREDLADVHMSGVGRTDEQSAEVIGPEDVGLGRSNPGGST